MVSNIGGFKIWKSILKLLTYRRGWKVIKLNATLFSVKYIYSKFWGCFNRWGHSGEKDLGRRLGGGQSHQKGEKGWSPRGWTAASWGSISLNIFITFHLIWTVQNHVFICCLSVLRSYPCYLFNDQVDGRKLFQPFYVGVNIQ